MADTNRIFANNASSRLLVGANRFATEITVQSADAAKFPLFTGPDDYFTCTLEDRRTGQIEITHCTKRVGTQLTIVRAREGTDAQDFEAGTLVSNRVTRDTMSALFDNYCEMASRYLGSFSTPPTEDACGNPIKPGATYYDLDTLQMLVWDGTSWQPFSSPTAAVESTLYYLATASQTVFNLATADERSNNFTLVGNEGVHAFLTGVRQIEDDGTTTLGAFNIDHVANTITFVSAIPLDTPVQFDILTDPADLQPGGVAIKALVSMEPSFDGIETMFELRRADTGDLLNVNGAEEVAIWIDNVAQEPGVGFTAVGDTATFLEAPRADANMHGFWYQPGTITAPGDLTIQQKLQNVPGSGQVWVDSRGDFRVVADDATRDALRDPEDIKHGTMVFVQADGEIHIYNGTIWVLSSITAVP